MRFKTSNTELEWAALHPLLKDLISRLDAYCLDEGIPEVVITEILRSPADQERLYWRQMQREFSLSEDAARHKARAKDSMHLWGCAVDLRESHWLAGQKKQVVNWLRIEMAKISKKPGFWEFLPDIHGSGPHVHIARKDHKWIADYRAKADRPFTIKAGITNNTEDPTA
jgi:hypothetical protein